MNSQIYLAISGLIFGIVAVFHLLRIVKSWGLVLGTWSVPMVASWVGLVFPALLCVWAFTLMRASRPDVLY